jgi:hypothetical protein
MDRFDETSAMTADERKQLLQDVDQFCRELRPSEEVAYVEHRLNDQLLPLARKYNVLGMPIERMPAATPGSCRRLTSARAANMCSTA